MPTIFKSKTLIFAVLIAVLSVLQGYVFLLPLTPTHQMLVGVVVAAVVAWLRWVTSQPLADK